MKQNSLVISYILYNFLILSTAMFIFTIHTNAQDTNAQGLTLPQEQSNYTCKEGTTKAECVDGNPITKWLQFFMNVISVVIVAGSAIMIAVGGLQYTAARDNPQAVQAAKQKIINVIVGLLFYFFLYAFLQWLVPGGIF